MKPDRVADTPGQSRRRFFQAAGALSAASLLSRELQAADPEENVFGPRPGYSPQIGTLVSEMNWMRGAVLGPVKGMTQDQLDFLLDAKANRIGALLLHLAATEKLYQLNTFDGSGADAVFQSAAFKEWALPMDLGGPARESIKGRDLNFYLDKLHEGREKTLAEFRKRDDAWLMAIDKAWPWGPTNNLCKWFHVCEHESHHTGQISLIKGRLPGLKSENG
jgi:hypothetical protein